MPLPPGHEPFLRAICANPADDAPRLVYADWLDENDVPQYAEFIRAQIELFRAREVGEPSEELVNHVRPLREAAELTWRPEMPRLRGVSWHRYWRGFISGADFHSAYWFFHQQAAFEAAPLQFIRIHGLRPPHMAKFLECTNLQRVEGLTLMGEPHLLMERGWHKLTDCEHLVNLRSLTVRGILGYRTRQEVVFSERVAKWLAESPVFANLEELAIYGYLTPTQAALLRERFGTGFAPTYRLTV